MRKFKIVHLGNPEIHKYTSKRPSFRDLRKLAKRSHIVKNTVYLSVEATKPSVGISTGLCFETKVPFLYIDSIPDCGCGFYVALIKNKTDLDWKLIVSDFIAKAGLYSPVRDSTAKSLCNDLFMSDNFLSEFFNTNNNCDIIQFNNLLEIIRAVYGLFVGHFLEIRRVDKVYNSISQTQNISVGDYILILHAGAPMIHLFMQQLCGKILGWKEINRESELSQIEYNKRIKCCCFAENFARKSRYLAARLLFNVLIDKYKIPANNIIPLSDICHSSIQLKDELLLHRRGIQDLTNKNNIFFNNFNFLLLAGTQVTSSYLVSPTGIYPNFSDRFLSHGTPENIKKKAIFPKLSNISSSLIYSDTKSKIINKNIYESITYKILTHYSETIRNIYPVARLIPIINIKKGDIFY